MRISDWSSDVCSSDLIVCEPCGEMIVRGTNFARARQKAEDVAGGFRQCTQRACCKVIAMRAAAGRRGAVADIDRKHAPAAFDQRRATEQIANACRAERRRQDRKSTRLNSSH